MIRAKLPWQRQLTGHKKLPDLSHIYLKRRRWLDEPDVTPSARPYKDWDEQERHECKVADCPNPPEPTLSDTKCEMHAMATINEEASRVIRALKAHDSDATMDELESAIWARSRTITRMAIGAP